MTSCQKMNLSILTKKQALKTNKGLCDSKSVNARSQDAVDNWSLLKTAAYCK